MATLKNNAVISFISPTGAWSVPTHFAVLRTSTSAIAREVTGTLSTGLAAPASGDTVEFAVGQLTITLTGDELTERAWKAMLTELKTNLYISLHTGTPVTGNELTGNSYARASTSSSDWTVA